jgi:hypothetical protein
MKQLGKWSENAAITETSRSGGLSRREFVRAATGVVAAVVGSQAESLSAAQPGNRRQPAGGRLLLKGGVVLTFDATLGDFEKADVLIEGKKIVAVQPNINATATVIDASKTIVLPGFIDSHHHNYQGAPSQRSWTSRRCQTRRSIAMPASGLTGLGHPRGVRLCQGLRT